MERKGRIGFGLLLAVVSLPGLARGAEPGGEAPALGDQRIRQEQIARGELSLAEVRSAGLRMFSTPFNRLDGYGERSAAAGGAPDGRPTLQGNGTLLRVDGLDGQTCIECHSIVSAATVPPTFGVGGVGGAVSNAMFRTRSVDPADLEDGDGSARFDGRFINPPFLFGVGAVELLAREMTSDLQALRQVALSYPGTQVELRTKGVGFGRIVADGQGRLDVSGVQGVAPDLVVRPFGRKGEFATLREFDVTAMQFHFGMQPVEVVGSGADPDADGVADEILPGELSALSIFLATLERPQAELLDAAGARGQATFHKLGCAGCHVPELVTRGSVLEFRFPEDPFDPSANVFYAVDLARPPTRFERVADGGMRVPLFADLKRHDMGPGLAESFVSADERTNREFTTARLWGVADTAPYLHDGRATTLGDAILAHGGEAQAARDAFAKLDSRARQEVLSFLRALRTPAAPAADLLESGDRRRAVQVSARP